MSGITRLVIELLVLVTGAAAIAVAGRRNVSVAFIALLVAHYMISTSRLQWMLDS